MSSDCVFMQKFQAISAAYTKLVSSDSEEEDDDIPNVSSSLSCVAACHSPIHSYIAAGQGIWLSSQVQYSTRPAFLMCSVC